MARFALMCFESPNSLALHRVEAVDLAAAGGWRKTDLYKLAGQFERAEIRPWRATVGEAP
jgi:uncharacterized protein YciI